MKNTSFNNSNNNNSIQLFDQNSDQSFLNNNQNTETLSRDNEFSSEFWNDVRTKNIYSKSGSKKAGTSRQILPNLVMAVMITFLMIAIGSGFNNYSKSEFSAQADSNIQKNLTTQQDIFVTTILSSSSVTPKLTPGNVVTKTFSDNYSN